MLRGKSAFFNEWRNYIEWELRTRAKLEKAFARMRHGALVSSWETWLEWVELARKAHRALMRFKNALLSRAFGAFIKYGTMYRCWTSWLGFSRLMTARRIRFVKKQQAMKRALAIGDEMIRRKKRLLLRNALTGWSLLGRRFVRVRAILASRMSSFKERAFRTWQTYVDDLHQERKKSAASMGLRRKLLLRFMLRAWRDAARVAAEEMRDKLARAFEFAFAQSLTMALVRWRQLVREGRKRKALVEQFVADMLDRGEEIHAKGAFSRWKEAVRQAHMGVGRMEQAKKHYTSRMIGETFTLWASFAHAMRLPTTPGELEKGRSLDEAEEAGHTEKLIARVRLMYDGVDPDGSDAEDFELLDPSSPVFSSPAFSPKTVGAAVQSARKRGTGPFGRARIRDDDDSD